MKHTFEVKIDVVIKTHTILLLQNLCGQAVPLLDRVINRLNGSRDSRNDRDLTDLLSLKSAMLNASSQHSLGKGGVALKETIVQVALLYEDLIRIEKQQPNTAKRGSVKDSFGLQTMLDVPQLAEIAKTITKFNPIHPKS